MPYLSSPLSSPLSAPALECRQLAKRYAERWVLQGIDLTLQPGEYVAIMGESGVGKELLARALHYASHRRDRPFVVDTLREQLRAAGLDSIPGGGGEILVDAVRRRVAQKKAQTEEGSWNDIHFELATLNRDLEICFSVEEALMRIHDCPGADEHRREHIELLDSVHALERASLTLRSTVWTMPLTSAFWRQSMAPAASAEAKENSTAAINKRMAYLNEQLAEYVNAKYKDWLRRRGLTDTAYARELEQMEANTKRNL